MIKRDLRRAASAAALAGLVAAALIAAPLVTASGTAEESKEIVTAALAPYRHFMERRAAGLCSDFTIASQVTLAHLAASGKPCADALAIAFGSSPNLTTVPVLTTGTELKPARIHRHNAAATVTLTYGPRGASFSLKLVHELGTWRIANRPHLRHIEGCVTVGRCTGRAATLLFWLGLPAVVRLIHSG
jgi:hypothetical protein